MKLDNYTCDGQMNIFDFIKEPVPDLSEKVGEWVKEHGDRVMFEDIKEGRYYIADYSTVSHEWYKIVFVKWIKDDSVGYVDSPKGIKGAWSWGNSYSALTRKQYINEPQTCGCKWYKLPSEEPDTAAGEPKTEVKESPRAADPEPRQLKSEQSKICQYSQHTCNKANLWEVADTLDGIKCPRTCCRICSVKSCGARCNGSEEPKRQQVTKEELDAKYGIPRDYQKEEGWTDDWHYCEIEQPKEHGIYYVIHHGLNNEYYNYTYMAWAYGHWWNYAGYGEKWLLVRGDRRKWMEPFAWVTVPDLYYRTDESYQFLAEHFVTKEDWEYEQRIEKLRK